MSDKVILEKCRLKNMSSRDRKKEMMEMLNEYKDAFS